MLRFYDPKSGTVTLRRRAPADADPASCAAHRAGAAGTRDLSA
jgi:hypothetical protein